MAYSPQKGRTYPLLSSGVQRRIRLPVPNPDFHIPLPHEPIIMHCPLPCRVLELEVEAYHQLRDQLVDFHEADVLAQAGAGAFAELWDYLALV